MGLPALLAIAASIAALLIGLYRIAWRSVAGREQQLAYTVVGLFLLQLFAIQFSGDINDNREFWQAFGLSWLVAQHGLPPDDAASGEGDRGDRPG
jgi:hypothetical protein